MNPPTDEQTTKHPGAHAMKRWIAAILIFFSTYAGALTLPTHMVRTDVQTTTTAPEGFYNYDMHLTMHNEPDVSKLGFYAQFYFDFQTGIGGYTGLQKDRIDGKKAIFSIWDIPNAQTSFPVASNCQRFGHEGAGTMCILPFQWKPGHEYKMRVWRLTDSYNGSTEKWGGWVIDYTSGEETLIGVIEVKNSNGLKGYGGLKPSTAMVSEYYGANSPEVNAMTCENAPYVGVTWNGPFANNGTISPDHASSSYHTNMGSNCSHKVRAVSNVPFAVTVEVRGQVSPANNEYQNVWEKHKLANFKEIDCLYNWAEQGMPAVFNQSVFKHRRLSRSLYNMYYRDYKVNGTGHALIADTTTNQVSLGKPDGVMENLGDLDHWKRQAGCKR